MNKFKFSKNIKLNLIMLRIFINKIYLSIYLYDKL